MPSNAAKTTQRGRQFWLSGALALAGVLSGMITIFLLDASGWRPFLGAVFGTAVVACLALRRMLGGAQAVIFIAVAGLVYPVALFASTFVEIASGFAWDPGAGSMSSFSSGSPLALFVGGLLGAFPITGVILFLLRSELGIGSIAVRAFLWSLAGGALAVIGWAFAPSLGLAAWRLLYVLNLTGPGDYSPTDQLGGLGVTAETVCSVHLVWQTGMALAIASMLRGYDPEQHEG